MVWTDLSPSQGGHLDSLDYARGPSARLRAAVSYHNLHRGYGQDYHPPLLDTPSLSFWQPAPLRTRRTEDRQTDIGTF